jgi:hypothetical protein
VEIQYVSGGMGATFAEYVRDMASRLQEFGPSPLKGNIQLSSTEQKTEAV